MGNIRGIFFIQMGNIENIDIFFIRSRIPPNMFRDKASILMEAKAKRKPSSTTSVVGFGLVLIKQEKEKELL